MRAVIRANFPHDDKPNIEAAVLTTASPRGYVCVRVTEEWSVDRDHPGDRDTCAMGHFTPKRARKLAHAIISAADAAEREAK